MRIPSPLPGVTILSFGVGLEIRTMHILLGRCLMLVALRLLFE